MTPVSRSGSIRRVSKLISCDLKRTGSVVEIRLTNPHSIVVFDAPDPTANGKVVRFQAEMGGGQQLVKQFGWNKDMPKIGDKITLTGRRVKNGAPYMNMTERAQILL